MRHLNLFGNHRGGTSIVNQLPTDVAQLYDADWTLADPKEGRAEQLARVVRNRFPTVHPRALRMTAQEALGHSRPDDALVLAMDTVADTQETLEARYKTQRATFQVIGRGPGGTAGTRTAIQGTLFPGDHETERGALLLLNTLGGMTRDASSRVLTGTDPLTASILRPMRDLATRQTVRHLVEMDRDPWDLSCGPLSVIFGTTPYPLVPVQGQPEDRYSQRKELALEVAGRVPTGQGVEPGASGRRVIVAVVVPEAPAIHFLTVARNGTGKRRVDGVTIFAPSPRMPEPWQLAASGPFAESDSAIFTD